MDNPKFNLRPASESEAGLFYAATPEKDAELGCIGHVRMDFGHGGREFWTTWCPRSEKNLNTPEFKEELGEVVEFLRKTVLKDLEAMSRYCGSHGGSISGGHRQNYGYIVDTDHYRYCLRCNPQPGDYQGYLTCFDLCQQELNQEQEENLRPLEDYGLTEKGRKALRDAENPNLPHRYNWFVVENFCCKGEVRHDTDSLTGAIDKFNGLHCGEKRLCVTKDDVATIYLAITQDGKTRLDESWRENPRFAADSVIEETAERLQLSIAGVESFSQTMGGM